MRIAIGGDHAGFELKDELIPLIEGQGHEVLDMGAHSTEPSDYPDFARSVGEAVRDGRADRGVLVCGSGAGVTVAANKIHGVRATLAHAFTPRIKASNTTTSTSSRWARASSARPSPKKSSRRFWAPSFPAKNAMCGAWKKC